MNKLWLFIRLFLAARKSWTAPRKSSVLIFDLASEEGLLEDLASWSPEVLDVSGKAINMPVLLGSFFRPGKQLDAYIDEFIERVQPGLVVTLIDNRLDFYTVSRRHPGLKTLFVQNGFRSYFADVFETLGGLDLSTAPPMKVDYMLTFGSAIAAEYGKYIEGAGIPIGSLKCNRAVRSAAKRPGRLVFISQDYHPHGYAIAGRRVSGDEYFRRADELVLKTLDSYAIEHGKQLSIVPRHRRPGPAQDRERSYFRELLGREPEFAPGQGQYAGYDATDGAEVSVAIDSTLGYEAIARGNRAAIFSIRGALAGVPKLTYGWPGIFPDDGPFWTNRPDTDAFIGILDYLFKTPEEQWRADVANSNFSAVLSYDPGNTILNSLLLKELGLPPAAAQ